MNIRFYLRWLFFSRWVVKLNFDQDDALSALVVSVYVGQWHLHATPAAHAQHRGAAGFVGPHSKDGCHQIGTLNHLGG